LSKTLQLISYSGSRLWEASLIKTTLFYPLYFLWESALRVIPGFLEKLFSKRKPKPAPRVYEEHVVPGNVVTEYRIGAYRVAIVDAGDRYEYVVSPVSDLEDLYNVVGEKLDDIVLLMKKGNDPGDVLSAVLGIPRERVADALYVLENDAWVRQDTGSPG